MTRLTPEMRRFVEAAADDAAERDNPISTDEGRRRSAVQLRRAAAALLAADKDMGEEVVEWPHPLQGSARSRVLDALGVSNVDEALAEIERLKAAAGAGQMPPGVADLARKQRQHEENMAREYPGWSRSTPADAGAGEAEAPPDHEEFLAVRRSGAKARQKALDARRKPIDTDTDLEAFEAFQAGGLDAIARRRKRRGHGVERPTPADREAERCSTCGEGHDENPFCPNGFHAPADRDAELEQLIAILCQVSREFQENPSQHRAAFNRARQNLRARVRQREEKARGETVGWVTVEVHSDSVTEEYVCTAKIGNLSNETMEDLIQRQRVRLYLVRAPEEAERE